MTTTEERTPCPTCGEIKDPDCDCILITCHICGEDTPKYNMHDPSNPGSRDDCNDGTLQCKWCDDAQIEPEEEVYGSEFEFGE